MFKPCIFRRLCSRNQCLIYSCSKNVDVPFFDGDSRRFVSGSTHLQVLDFQEMPSPRGLPFVGTAFSLIMAGGYTRLHQYIDEKHKELGPVFKDNVGPVTAVFLSDAEEMRKVFAKEGEVLFLDF